MANDFDVGPADELRNVTLRPRPWDVRWVEIEWRELPIASRLA
jgi:hypothetical protein